MGSNPVQACIFFRLHFPDNCLSVHNCDGQSYPLLKSDLETKIRCDEGLTLETPAFESLYGGQ